MRARVIISIAALFSCLSALQLQAQIVVGRVVEPGIELGIPAVFVTLLSDEGEALRASALTDSVGRFVIRAPAAGRYRLRAERIGHATTISPPLVLAEGQSLDYRLEVRVAPIAIEGISIQARSQCRLRPEAGPLTALLWEEAKKALSVVAWAGEAQILHYDVVHYERELELESLLVIREQRRPRLAVGSSPFRALPAERLSRAGYFETMEDGSFQFYGPDAHVLLSESFLEDHCFRVHEAPPDLKGMIGLQFEPRSGRSVPDVAGVLWLDARSSELRFVEYSYTGLPAGLDKRHIGGRIEFERVPTGEWIVRRWRIRMPRIGAVAGAPVSRGESDRALLGIKESGGEVVGIRPQVARARPRAGGAIVEGVVFDTLAGAPLADAIVFVSGTSFHAVTDVLGHFRIEGLSAGEHVISYHHGILDALDLFPDPVHIRLADAETRTIELAVPSQAVLLARACPEEGQGKGGTLVGTVRDARTGRMLPGVAVVLESGRWVRRDAGQGGAQFSRTGGSLSVDVAADGYYRVCGIPAGAPIQAYAVIGEQRSDAVRIHLRAGAVDRHDFTLDAPAALLESLPRVGGALTRAEVFLGSDTGRARSVPGALRGRIESASGVPLVGAVAYLSGSDLAAETDSTGGFAIEAVPAGQYALVWFDPELDPAGELVEPLGVRVESGKAAHVVIRVAGLDERMSGCSAERRTPGSTVIHGTAREAHSGTPLGGARVRLAAAADTIEALTDSGGRFRFCAAAPGPATLLGRIGTFAETAEQVSLAPDGIVQRDLLFTLTRPAGREAELFGRVLGEDGKPVDNVAIRLVGTDRQQMSDARGHFIFRDLKPGTYAVRASHIGYAESEGALVVTPGERTEFEVRLATRAIELEGIVVTARRNIMHSSFYDRLSSGLGSFITREMIEQRSASQVSHLLKEAGVEITSAKLFMRRTGCAPLVYLNGIRITDSDRPADEAAREAVDLVSPADVEGIEVFRGPAQVPPEFGGNSAGCGVIAIWTRRGNR